MIDVDQILRDHAEAATIDVAPDAWDRLVARLDDEPPIVVPLDGRDAGRGPAPRSRLLAAAAVVAVALVAGAVAIAGSGDDEAEPRPLVTAPPTTVAPPTSTTESVAVSGPMPESVVAVLDRHADAGPPAVVIRFDQIGESFEDVDEDGTPVRGLEPAVRTTIDVDPELGDPTEVEVSVDGLAYVARTNADGSSEVTVVDVATGESRGRGISGRAPAVSADGQRLAVWDPAAGGLHVYDLRGGDGTVVPDPAGAAVHVDDIAWSPDGRTLARGVSTRGADGRTIASTWVEVLDLAAAEPAWSEPVDGAGGWAHPAFLADGRLVVGTGTQRGVDVPTATGLAVVDLDTGVAEPRFGMLEITAVDATADGRWILAVDRAGAVRAFRGHDLVDSGTVVQEGGLVDAAW